MFTEVSLKTKMAIRGLMLVDFYVNKRTTFFIILTYVTNIARALSKTYGPIFLSSAVGAVSGSSDTPLSRMCSGATPQGVQLSKKMTASLICSFARIIDQASPSHTLNIPFLSDYGLPHLSTTELLVIGGMLLGAEKITKSINEYISSYIQVGVSEKLIAQGFIPKLHRLNVEYIETKLQQNNTSGRILKLTEETSGLVRTAVDQFTPLLFNAFLTHWVLTADIMPEVATYMILYTLWSILINITLAYYQKSMTEKTRKEAISFNNILNDDLRNIGTIRLHCQTEIHRQQESQAFLGFTNRIKENDAYPSLFKLLFVKGVHLLVLLAVIMYFSRDSITKDEISSLVLILNYFHEIHASAETFGRSILDSLQAVDIIKEFTSHNQAHQVETSQIGALPLQFPNDIPIIEFINVSYLAGSKTILNNVSFRILPNQSCALVGKSGGGKTTIIKLICGEYRATSGTIKIGGRNIETLDLANLRSKITLINHQTQLFKEVKDSSQRLRYNVLYGHLTGNDLSFRCQNSNLSAHNEALFQLKAQESSLTHVANDMQSASAGEQQRIGWARGWRETPIMILDEPTSAQDSVTENNLINNFNKFVTPKLPN